MHRHVGSIGDEVARLIEQRTGKIKALFDVDRGGGVFQHHAHMLGNRHEEVIDDLQHHRVDLGADGNLCRQGTVTLQQNIAVPVEGGPPTRLDHDGTGSFDNDRWTSYRLVHPQ